jgi:SPP1 family predicted phage head-tail adaptor
MRAGELRQRIAIQQNTPTRDSTNAEMAHWSTIVTLWARIDTLTGTEEILQQQAAAVRTHKLTIRRYASLTTVMRVVWKNSVFDILTIIDDNTNRQMTLMCREVQRG